MTNQLAAVIDLTKEAVSAGVPGAGGGSPEANFGNYLGGIMSGIMGLAAILVLLYLIWGAVEWITSGGEKSKVEAARNKITQAILGLIVLAATVGLFMLLQNFLGICVLEFDDGCSGGYEKSMQELNTNPKAPIIKSLPESSTNPKNLP